LAALSAAHELLKKEPERALPILAKVADEGSLLSISGAAAASAGRATPAMPSVAIMGGLA